jgi:hypothetical protein
MEKGEKNTMFVYLGTRVIFRIAFANYAGVTWSSKACCSPVSFISITSLAVQKWEVDKGQGLWGTES